MIIPYRGFVVLQLPKTWQLTKSIEPIIENVNSQPNYPLAPQWQQLVRGYDAPELRADSQSIFQIGRAHV